jgi:regulator of protease activity HflC (stomatin/prohibitin superfamily)
VQTEQNRAEQAKWRAQSAIEEAKGEAQATIENARGNAEKIKLIAEAEAESIQLKGEALAEYPEIIQLEFVNSLKDPDGNVSWGIMPQGGILPFLDVTPEGMQQP